MGNLAKLFGTDKQKEEEGVEVDLGEGIKVTVARANNKTYANALQKKFAQHRRQIRNRTLPDDVVERLTIEAMADGILLGWSGVTENDQPVDYSRDNAIAMLTKYPDFRDTIADIAADAMNYREQSEEEARGNS